MLIDLVIFYGDLLQRERVRDRGLKFEHNIAISYQKGKRKNMVGILNFAKLSENVLSGNLNKPAHRIESLMVVGNL